MIIARIWGSGSLSAGVEEDAATARKDSSIMNLLLFILAAILVIAGVMSIIRHQVLWGIVLIVVGLLVGPGGASVFT